MAFTVPHMRQVTREEYHAYIQKFPDRSSSRTGICEPPEEHCVNDGVLIGRIVYPYDNTADYWVRDDDARG
jgi:hypothetical protein